MKAEKINLSNLNLYAPKEIAGWRTIALGAGGVATVVLLLWALLVPDAREQVLRSWLFGFIFWCGIGVGCLGLLILQYLTGGAWGIIIRRIVEAGARTLPILAVLFIPLMLGFWYMYEWVHPGTDEVLQHKQPYLNPMFWGIRAVLYFGLWSLMSYLLNNWSNEQDRTGNFELSSKMSRFSGPTLVIFVLLITFASVDWVMSLEPHWFSTIFGLLYAIGWALSALSFVVILLAWLAEREPMKHLVGKKHFHDLGKLMLAMVMVWAYFNFSQFLIIWSGNLPEETGWYLTRMKGGWGALGMILIVFHFAFPFLMLLSRDVKRNTRYLTILALLILLMRFLDYYFVIGPSPMVSNHGAEAHAGFHINFTDFVAPVAIGGIWLWWFFGELVKRPLVPVNEPFLENAIAHGQSH